MVNALQILAGKTAYDHIQENGLSPSDISAVLGASGAAKWLGIYGLDSAIFSQWFKGREEPLQLFGTSIGAWKLAAAAHNDPAGAFDRLKDAYIAQSYKGRPTPAKVSEESIRINEAFMEPNSLDQIFSHPYCRLSFGAVRCQGLMGREEPLLLLAGMVWAYALNLASRDSQGRIFERTVFHDARMEKPALDMSDFPTESVPFTPENFSRALLATGSIPLVMDGVTGIPGAKEGIYRDGGLLDYHPSFPLAQDVQGFILYPHFYPHVVRGWFDKKMPGRWADSKILDKTIILAPSPEFVSRLPFARIPDRKDFARFSGKDHIRQPAWHKAADMSQELGQEFLCMVEGRGIKDAVRLIG